MDDEWFYAVDNTQHGPVTAAELVAFEQVGKLHPSSLVWRQGMTDWQPWSTVAAELRARPGLEAEMAVCAYSGRALPKSQMVKYGDHFVAIENKDAFVEALREGRAVERLPGTGGMEYVGFWWRVLASVIDWAVKLIPNMLCLVPYYVLAFTQAGAGPPAPGSNPFLAQWTIGLVFAYIAGLLGNLAISIFYDTWMVGKYGGTVGKLALSFRVVNADGTKVNYAKAFGRWAAEVMEKFIGTIAGYGSVAVAAALLFVIWQGKSPTGGMIAFTVVAGVLAIFVGVVLGCLPWLMAGWTREKTALHDKMCGTRVIRKAYTNVL
ncbi:MAG: RDD family protein [Verrucomicrobiales bacterium]